MPEGFSTPDKTVFDTIHDYFLIWLRYKWFVIITTIVITGAVVALCIESLRLPPSESFMPNVYTAQGRILIQQRAQDDIANTILANLGVPVSASNSRNFDYGAQIIELGRSRTIIDQLIKEFGLYDGNDPQELNQIRTIVTWGYQFQYSAVTALMNISYTSSDPELAKNMVNRMISLLDEWYVTNSTEAKTAKREVLEVKLAEVNKDIARLGNLMKRIPDIDPAYAQYSAELEIQQRIYNSLFPQYEASRLVPESQPVFQIFELAEIPVMKTGPDRKKFIMLAFVGAFGGSSAIGFGLNYLKAFRRKRRD